MKNATMKLLDKFRTPLFGVGALGVLLVHSASLVRWPYPIGGLIDIGGIGVYIFAFLSGIGLYQSMTYRKKQSVWGGYSAFYKKRFLRVGIPYLIIGGTWYTIKYLFISFDLPSLFYELSTLSFWIEHKGAWYVAMLIPLYLAYPILYDFIEKRNRRTGILVTLFSILLVSFCTYMIDQSMYEHLSQVFNSLIVFALGSYYGESAMKEREFPYKLMLFGLLFYPARMIIPQIKESMFIGNLSYAFLGVGICLLFGIILNFIPRCFSKALRFFGEVSLESYLTNIFLLQGMVLPENHSYLPSENSWVIRAMIYLTICVVGLALSYLTRIICTRVVEHKHCV